LERGPRKEMLKKERDLVETQPGPKNKEPWAGKRKDEMTADDVFKDDSGNYYNIPD
jgi:hypothetical protein